MQLRRWITLAAALAAVGIPGMSRASDQDALQNERYAVARFSAANIVSGRHGRYFQARAIALDGDGSVRQRSSAWLTKMHAYLEGWTKVLALADLKDDMPYAAFETELTRLLQEETRQLEDLSQEATHVARLADSARALIAKPEAVFPFPELAQYQSVLATLETREAEVRSLLLDVGHAPEGKVSRLGEVDTASRKAVLARVKAALLARARYPLDQTLAQVDALLSAERAVDPALTRLQLTFTRMNEYNVGLAYFHAQAAIGPARTDCAEVQRTFADLSSPKSFVEAAKRRAEQLCAGIESLHTSLTGDTSISKAEYVGEYLRSERTRIGSVCSPTVSSPPCEKLALLAALSPGDLTKMDDARLRFVELGWSEAMDRALGK